MLSGDWGIAPGGGVNGAERGSRRRALGSATMRSACVRGVFSGLSDWWHLDCSGRRMQADPWEAVLAISLAAMTTPKYYRSELFFASRFGLPRVLVVGMHANYVTIHLLVEMHMSVLVIVVPTCSDVKCVQQS
jgi:hypothetical protein